MKKTTALLSVLQLVVLLPLLAAAEFLRKTAQQQDDHHLILLPHGGGGGIGRLLDEETCTESCCQQQYNVEKCPENNGGSEESSSPFSGLPSWVSIVMIGVLISMSAMFSGLTLGLMGLDKTGLEIIMDSEDAKNAAYARKIFPLRKNGNLLLCTLLLGNTSVNALLSILMADFTGGTLGFIISTFLILIFGEIIPQATCSRFALQIGSRAVPVVRVIMVILYPVTKPLAMALDCALGEELATTYSGNEMLKLLQIHVEENVLDKETADTMTGALKYKEMSVRDVMTPLANVFMLKTDEKLNFETIAKIFKTGYSRVPVYEVSKNNVIGLLFVKDLIFLDPADETRVADFIEIFGRGVHVVWPDDKLGDVLGVLKQGRSHMALVRDVNNEDDSQDPFYEVTGIITLEDIVEEILGDEIVDETDAFLDGTHSVKLDRADAFKFARLRLLDSKIVDEKLSTDEVKAVTAHLWKNYPEVVSLLTENQLYRLISETPVSNLPTAEQRLGEELPSDLLYEKGVPNDVCTLVLAGKVTVLVGVDQFRSDVSTSYLLGSGALTEPNFKPDFSAYVSSGPCRCIRISRKRFTQAVDASALERTSHDSSQGELVSEVANNATESGERPTLTTSDSSSRQSMLITALKAVEMGSKRNNPTEQEKQEEDKPSTSVMFAEPGSLSERGFPRGQSSRSERAFVKGQSSRTETNFEKTPSSRIESEAPNVPAEATSDDDVASPFEFIASSPAKDDALDKDKS